MKNDGDTGSLKVTETADGVIFTVHVQPRASRNEICGVQGDELRLRLTAPPVDDAANKLCIELLAKALGVAKSHLALTSGAKSRHKTIRVEGVSRNTVLSLVK
ncbi:DUF167 domain-containing protein [Geotalea toluenoxydans]|uniref:DUF167 domain-containing protein n=1 Tax=Geotalea toluenoxydans TaxID=421624 RepID=UPI0006D0BF35|nr:DUF167 domain-containing protein [Geotalea toluenoxydans]